MLRRASVIREIKEYIKREFPLLEGKMDSHRYELITYRIALDLASRVILNHDTIYSDLELIDIIKKEDGAIIFNLYKNYYVPEDEIVIPKNLKKALRLTAIPKRIDLNKVYITLSKVQQSKGIKWNEVLERYKMRYIGYLILHRIYE